MPTLIIEQHGEPVLKQATPYRKLTNTLLDQLDDLSTELVKEGKLEVGYFDAKLINADNEELDHTILIA